jgi:glycosyltransferase involved in cell wall biosynthesis
MESKGLVSILCLSMNHERYVEQAYTSVINQTWRNIEIIYVDNNSKDQTFEISDSIFKRSGLPYKGHKRKENYGISANLNYLISQASGEYVAVLSGDDWWELDNIEEKVKVFNQDPALGMVYGNGYIYYQKEQKAVLNYKDEQRSGKLFKELLYGNFLFAASVMVKTSVMKDLRNYDEESPIEDWDMWLRISEKYPIGYSHKPTVYSRYTGSNLSSNIEFMNKGFNYIFNKYKAYPEIRIAKKNIRMAQAYQLASTKPGWNSLSYILRHLQWNPKYIRQVFRCLGGMLGNKNKPALTS